MAGPKNRKKLKDLVTYGGKRMSPETAYNRHMSDNVSFSEGYVGSFGDWLYENDIRSDNKTDKEIDKLHQQYLQAKNKKWMN